MTTPLDAFIRRRQRGADLLDALADVAQDLALPPPTPAEADSDAPELPVTRPDELLRITARRAREGRFVVLLLGCFSSGKSTLLNALLSRPVLPVKVNPCTAILTEVVHGESPGVQVRYHDRPPEQMSIEGFVEAFQLRTHSLDEAGAEAADRFGGVDRAVVRWPLPILQNGVVLLDTPGLDDDDVRTARTLSSLPDADAVIVVLSANRFLTDLERRTLRRNLLPLGLTNLFFPVTMVDLLDAISDDPERDLADLTARAREVLGPLSKVEGADRFHERFFPLDARGGLAARWDTRQGVPREPADAEAWERSGLAAFESSLERFLVQERGAVQLRHLHQQAARVREELARHAELDQATASASVEELRTRQSELEPRFTELQAIARRVGRTTDAFIRRQQALVWQDLRDFMAETEADLPEAVESFDLGGLAGLDLLTPKGRARVEAQLGQELERWLEERIGAWQRSLRPLIERSLWELRRELAADAKDFEDLSSRIVTDFAGGTLRLPASGGAEDGPKVDPAERWLSLALGAVLLSPGTMAAGWAEGYEGALKGAAGRLGVRVAVLALGVLIGPVGWAGLMLYLVSDAVLLVLTGGSQLKRLRDQVAERLQGQLVEQADAAREEIERQVADGLAPLRDALVGAAKADADALRTLLERTVAAREQAARDAASRAESWRLALARFDETLPELRALASDLVDEG